MWKSIRGQKSPLGLLSPALHVHLKTHTEKKKQPQDTRKTCCATALVLVRIIGSDWLCSPHRRSRSSTGTRMIAIEITGTESWLVPPPSQDAAPAGHNLSCTLWCLQSPCSYLCVSHRCCQIISFSLRRSRRLSAALAVFHGTWQPSCHGSVFITTLLN